MAEYSTSVKIQVLKPSGVVFEGIVDPKHMTNYWISKSSGRMEDNTTLTWNFPEFEDSFQVKIVKLEKERYVSFSWMADGHEDLVEMTLEPVKKGTKVTITERRLDNEPMSLQWVKGSTEGWSNFLASMKAYLEYGINLRKGAFEFLRA